jgi:GntR family transcriptional regulator
MLRLNPHDPVPLWRQIEEGVRNLVASGALPAGAPVPSVRELARDLVVNPATIARAYQRLCDAGVLESRRGDGTYVSATASLLPAEERRRRLLPAARSFAANARTLGVSEEQAVSLVREAMQELEEAIPSAGNRDETERG